MTSEGSTIAEGIPLRNDIYVLKSELTPSRSYGRTGPSANVSSALRSECPFLWHRRLGHLNPTYMTKLMQTTETGIRFRGDNIKNLNCKICTQGKYQKQPYLGSESRASELIELVHSDVCQVDDLSIKGYKYFITFVDDFPLHKLSIRDIIYFRMSISNYRSRISLWVKSRWRIQDGRT